MTAGEDLGKRGLCRMNFEGGEVDESSSHQAHNRRRQAQRQGHMLRLGHRNRLFRHADLPRGTQILRLHVSRAGEAALPDPRPVWKPRSARRDRQAWDNVLLPRFGKRKVADMQRENVAALHAEHKDKPIRANDLRRLLSKSFNLAEVWRWRPEGTNPCRHVKRYKDSKRERYLSEEELGRLGRVLAEAEPEAAFVAANDLGPDLPRGRARESEHPRPEAQLRQHRHQPGCQPARDRKASRSPADHDDGALCPPGGRSGADGERGDRRTSPGDVVGVGAGRRGKRRVGGGLMESS